MDTASLFDRLLPVVTLLIGAGLTTVGTRREQRRAASDYLAELQKHVWQKGGEGDWLDLQVYLGRLRVALRSAGVPQRLVTRMDTAARSLWEGLEDTGDPEIGFGASQEVVRAVEWRQDLVLDWLDRPWHIVRRWKSWRASGSDTPPD